MSIWSQSAGKSEYVAISAPMPSRSRATTRASTVEPESTRSSSSQRSATNTRDYIIYRLPKKSTQDSYVPISYAKPPSESLVAYSRTPYGPEYGKRSSRPSSYGPVAYSSSTDKLSSQRYSSVGHTPSYRRRSSYYDSIAAEYGPTPLPQRAASSGKSSSKRPPAAPLSKTTFSRSSESIASYRTKSPEPVKSPHPHVPSSADIISDFNRGKITSGPGLYTFDGIFQPDLSNLDNEGLETELYDYKAAKQSKKYKQTPQPFEPFDYEYIPSKSAYYDRTSPRPVVYEYVPRKNRYSNRPSVSPPRRYTSPPKKRSSSVSSASRSKMPKRYETVKVPKSTKDKESAKKGKFHDSEVYFDNFDKSQPHKFSEYAGFGIIITADDKIIKMPVKRYRSTSESRSPDKGYWMTKDQAWADKKAKDEKEDATNKVDDKQKKKSRFLREDFGEKDPSRRVDAAKDVDKDKPIDNAKYEELKRKEEEKQKQEEEKEELIKEAREKRKERERKEQEEDAKVVEENLKNKEKTQKEEIVTEKISVVESAPEESAPKTESFIEIEKEATKVVENIQKDKSVEETTSKDISSTDQEQKVETESKVEAKDKVEVVEETVAAVASTEVESTPKPADEATVSKDESKEEETKEKTPVEEAREEVKQDEVKQEEVSPVEAAPTEAEPVVPAEPTTPESDVKVDKPDEKAPSEEVKAEDKADVVDAKQEDVVAVKEEVQSEEITAVESAPSESQPVVEEAVEPKDVEPTETTPTEKVIHLPETDEAEEKEAKGPLTEEQKTEKALDKSIERMLSDAGLEDAGRSVVAIATSVEEHEKDVVEKQEEEKSEKDSKVSPPVTPPAFMDVSVKMGGEELPGFNVTISNELAPLVKKSDSEEKPSEAEDAIDAKTPDTKVAEDAPEVKPEASIDEGDKAEKKDDEQKPEDDSEPKEDATGKSTEESVEEDQTAKSTAKEKEVEPSAVQVDVKEETPAAAAGETKTEDVKEEAKKEEARDQPKKETAKEATKEDTSKKEEEEKKGMVDETTKEESSKEEEKKVEVPSQEKKTDDETVKQDAKDALELLASLDKSEEKTAEAKQVVSKVEQDAKDALSLLASTTEGSSSETTVVQSGSSFSSKTTTERVEITSDGVTEVSETTTTEVEDVQPNVEEVKISDVLAKAKADLAALKAKAKQIRQESLDETQSIQKLGEENAESLEKGTARHEESRSVKTSSSRSETKGKTSFSYR